MQRRAILILLIAAALLGVVLSGDTGNPDVRKCNGAKTQLVGLVTALS